MKVEESKKKKEEKLAAVKVLYFVGKIGSWVYYYAFIHSDQNINR